MIAKLYLFKIKKIIAGIHLKRKKKHSRVYFEDFFVILQTVLFEVTVD
jgi:hypothetical protein